MRTIQEIQAEIDAYHPGELPDDEFTDNEDESHIRGYQGGLDKALDLIRAGYDSAAILQHAREWDARYQSVGCERDDAWHAGWVNALLWAGELFDYAPDGSAIMRA